MSSQIKPDCPICLSEDSDMCIPCGNFHWVHRKCWKSVKDKNICPMCRENLWVLPSIDKQGVINVDSECNITSVQNCIVIIQKGGSLRMGGDNMSMKNNTFKILDI